MNARIIDNAWHPLVTGCPPHWASGWGQDRHGVFVEFTVQEITQRLRWIPPGRFWMGSPESESGRYDAEGPRHQVTLTEGFWLFDTPCTQALWQEVMEKNPSRFQSPTRPVERVSWDDVQTFLGRINERLSGLNLVLPSEAQWEYACRAGTETALYSGNLEILGERNAPALDPIAWYGGNSGVDFDLDNGYDSSDWKEKQYPHTRAGTRPVKLKRANPWGLHDMLGNVWEWTQDHWHENYQGAPNDGSAWSSGDAGANRGPAWRVLERRRAPRAGGVPLRAPPRRPPRQHRLSLGPSSVVSPASRQAGAERPAPGSPQAERRGAKATGRAPHNRLHCRP